MSLMYTLNADIEPLLKEWTMDPITQFKEMQKQGWARFAPLQAHTISTAARLVKFAAIRSGQRVLDVGCGTGVVAITAARLGAKVTGIDLTPELVSHARENSNIANVVVEWQEGDVESLPFVDSSFDVVVSQFAHMFGPRPEIAIREMLRVLKPGGRIAFATWPPELLVGRSFSLVSRYASPPPPGVAPPALWGDPNVVRERLGNAVKQLTFDRGRMDVPALSVQHLRNMVEQTAGPVVKLVEFLNATDPGKLDAFRSEYDSLISEYFEENIVRQDYLLTKGRKA